LRQKTGCGGVGGVGLTKQFSATTHRPPAQPLRTAAALPDSLPRNAAPKLSNEQDLFLGGISRLSDTALQRLCDPDYSHDMAYIALAADPTEPGGERQVGVCRYAGAAADGAEISVAVADEWQHQGLGQILLRRLIDYARAHGIHRLYSMDAVNNERMRQLARHAGFAEDPDPADIHQVIYSLQLQRA
jgi:GNAT superfamily N-acetyltransferase